MDKLIRIGKVVNSYYYQLKKKEITEEKFSLWIESLQDPMKKHFKDKGLEKCSGVLNFQRFILELQDNGLEEYLKNELSDEDFTYWTDHSE
jgi:hypothetical protein